MSINHEFVKYQSIHNSSWYIGFDEAGSPISGFKSINKDGSVYSLRREQCYQFLKTKQLRTTVQLFPEVISLNDAFNKTVARQRELGGSLLAANGRNLLGKLRDRPPEVLSYDQEQLINMAKYRNIIEFKRIRESRQRQQRSKQQPVKTIRVDEDGEKQHVASNLNQKASSAWPGLDGKSESSISNSSATASAA